MTPKMSKRLLRAAQAEQDQLEAQRTDLLRRREEARQLVEEIEQRLYALDERLRLLDRLAGAELARRPSQEEIPAVEESSNGGGPQLQLLRGTAIRETAVRILAERGAGPIHYRRWYELLREAGYEVAGKDPGATLLTQISRSPIVRRTTSSGMYEIDHEAPERLQRELARLQAELRDLTASPTNPEERGEMRARRDKLVAEIALDERALEEADRVLSPRSRLVS